MVYILAATSQSCAGQSQETAQAIAALAGKDFTVRWEATYRLGQAADKDAAPALAKTLADESHEYVRGGAAWALGRIGPAGAAVSLAPLTAALDSTLISVRRHAAEALGRLGPAAQSAVPKLLARFDDEDPVVRVCAAAAVWQIAREPKGMSFLVDLLRKPHEPTRCDAVLALAELGDDARPALPDLIKLLGDADADTARAATVALGRLGAPALAELTRVLAEKQPLGERRAIAALEAFGPAAIPIVVAALADQDPSVRRTAARALGRLGPAAQTAIPALVRVVNDPVEEVRTEAAGALRRIRSAKPLEQRQP